MWPALGKSFSILLHPFHPGVDVARVEPDRCKKCRSWLTPPTRTIISVVEVKCSFCGTINQAEPHKIPGPKLPGVFDPYIDISRPGKKVLFLIEAN